MNKINIWIGKASFFLAALTIIFIVISISWEVVSRYILGSSSVWVTEVAGYLLAAGLFLGLGRLYRLNGHVRMTALLDSVRPSIAYFLYLFTDFVTAGFGLVLAWQNAQLALDSYNFNWRSSTLLEAPLYIPQAAMTIGSAVFFLQVIHTALARTPEDPVAIRSLEKC